MNQKKCISISTSVLFFLLFIFQTLCFEAKSEDIQIYATLVPTNMSTTLSSVEVIGEDEILKSSAHDLGELLSMKSSYVTSRNGGIGSVSTVMIRGGSSEYSILIIDGVRQVDGTKGAGGFSAQNIDISSIKKIEIIKDASGVLYGDGALSGVIKITTKENLNTGHLKFQKESHNSHGAEISFSKNIYKVKFNLLANIYKTDGISSYNKKRIIGEAEKDGFQKEFLRTDISYKLNKNHRVLIFANTTNSDTQTDDFNSDTKLDHISFKKNSIGTKYQGKFLDGIIKSDLLLNRNKMKRKYYSQFSKIHYEANDIQFKNINNIFLNEFNTIYLGIEAQEDDYIDNADSKYKRRYQESVFVGDQLKYKNIFLNLGARSTWVENSKDYRSFKFGIGVEFIKNFVLKANVSNAYKVPTLFQLYSEKWGNEELSMTKSTSSSLMLIGKIKQLKFDLSYFDNRYINEISYDFVSEKYFNIGKSQVQGHEINLELEDFLKTAWTLGYTKLLARDLINHKYLTNRAKTKIIFGQRLNINKEFKILANTSYIGKRNSYSGQVMPGYVLHDLAFSYKYSFLSKQSHKTFVNFNIKNIFDREYEEVLGYGTYGRTMSLTLQRPFSL